MSVVTANVWPKKRLKYAVSLRRTRVGGADEERPYVGLEQIESGTGRLVPMTATTESDSDTQIAMGESLSNTFEPGDVLFCKLRPYLAKAWIAEFTGRCTTELVVMQPTDFDARFLRYVCLSRDFVDAVDASTFGSKMPQADWDFIGNMPVPIPTLQRQCDIADYLDRETARVRAGGGEGARVGASGGEAAGAHHPCRHARPRPLRTSPRFRHSLARRNAGALGTEAGEVVV